MNGSNNMDEANRKPFLLCPVCLRKLMSCLGFNALERYREIMKACEEIGGKYF